MSEISKPNKLYRISIGAKPEEIKERNEKVAKGEIKWWSFSIDNDKYYHNYIILKK